MLDLHTFGPAFGAPDASPFCIKLECFLKMAGLAYERRPADLAEAPKGKAPYVRLGGRLIGDSALIIAELEASSGIDLDAGLDPRTRAGGHALAVMLEERTYFALVFARWHEPEGWPIIRAAYFADLPDHAREAIRAESLATLRQQGIGRHGREEIYALACRDVDALAAWLGGQTYMGGEQPGKVDATAYAFLASLLVEPFDGPLRRAVRAHPGLVAYTRRMAGRFFPDFVPAA